MSWMITLLIVFGIVWLLLLLDCLRRDRFFPVLGPGIQTKALWLMTFSLVSPLLVALYLVFGKLLKPRASVPVWARAGILISIAAAAAVQFIPLSSAGRSPFTLVRDAATGRMLREGGSGRAGLSLNASVLSAESNSTSVSSVSSGFQAALMCGHLTLLNLSDHPLMHGVGEDLAHRLGELPAVRKVDYFPANSSPPPGSRRPDLLLTLDLGTIDETTLPAYRQLEAEVRVNVTSDVWPGNRTHTFTPATPPVISLNWTLTLQHRSRTVGYESANARRRVASQNIAEEVGGSLGKQLDQWQEEHGLLQELPEGFYGPYREARDVPFADEPACRQMLSLSGLFEHNRTIWLIEDPRETPVVIDELRRKLEATGWTTRSQSPASGEVTDLRLRQGDRALEIFPEQRQDAVPEPTTGRIIILYHEPVSPEARCAALAARLDELPTAETLLRFEPMADTCGAELRERWGLLIESERNHSRRDAGATP
ncbi:MAG: hypothetical protein GXY55_00215 [Phycisphaerae bacterium]|mgnify:CR=1 FL=1|nr:hypothetical protein [Phycisphaerae bacterium]